MDVKEHGNELFKAGKTAEARDVYSDGIKQCLKAADSQQDELLVTLYSNRAMCHLKLEDAAACLEDCTAALEKDRSNIKVLFRRAQALMMLKRIEDAYKDLRMLLEKDPSNAAAATLMKKLRAAAQDQSSTTTQALEHIDAVASDSCSPKDRTLKLRQLLGTVMDDPHLAKAVCLKGACDKLWALRDKDALSLKVLSKLTEYEGCFEAVLAVADEATLAKIADSGAEQAEGQEVDAALADSAPAALNILWRLFKHETDRVEQEEAAAESRVNGDAVLEALVRALQSDDESVRRVAVEGVVRVCSGSESRSRHFFDLQGLEALMSMIARQHDRDEPMQQVSVVLGQVLPSLKDDEVIKSHAVAFCKPFLLSEDVFEQTRGVAGLNAIYYANKELGLALVQEEGLLEPLKRLAIRGSARTQALSAEVFSHVANSETGRGLLAGEATDTLKLLSTSDTAAVRSAAAVALAKLNAIDFNAESENGMLVLASVKGLLDVKASKEEHGKGVEAVSFVITDSQVKMMFIKGEGLKVLEELVKLATDMAKEPYAYGLAFIFENLTMSEDDKRREKLREMEVSEEQWQQFEKLTKSQSRKPGQEDPRANVEMRIQVFVQSGAVGALRALVLNSTSEKVWEAAARTLCNIASVPQVRGQMIAQGGLRALFKLTSAGSDRCKQFAAHALGKIFVTTDPHVLKDEQLMDTVGPLVRQVRHCDEDLVLFECCMALTNIATVSFEAKQKIVTARGIQAFEYAQYSENLMVRRAATEALNNLIPVEEVIEWICRPDKLRLWLLFAQSYEEDAPTACAATGALANLAQDERVGEALSKQEENAMAKLVELVGCPNLDIVHRAVVCVLYLLDTWPEGGGRAALKAAGGEAALAKVVAKHGDSSAAPVAQQCLEELKAPAPPAAPVAADKGDDSSK